MSEWQPIETAPQRQVVETKIHDAAGERNHALLRLEGNLWFIPGAGMYVYYAPTHWRLPPPPSEAGR